jgi:hypothetical protein
VQAAQQRFAHELEQQRLASVNLEERHAAEMRSLLLDVDRERLLATKLQKDLAMCQREQSDQTELAALAKSVIWSAKKNSHSNCQTRRHRCLMARSR